MWTLMIVLAIGVNLVVASAALAACSSSADCFECVDDFCEIHGGTMQWDFAFGECTGKCTSEPYNDWFDCDCSGT